MRFTLVWFFIAFAVGAQNLDNEFALKTQLKSEHVSGLGPSLELCDLTKEGDLKCVTGEHLVSLNCSAIRSAREQSLNAKLSKTGFVCEKGYEKELEENVATFNTRWRVQLVGENGKSAEYIVTASQPSQQARAYSAELRSVALPNKTWANWAVGLLGLSRLGGGSSAPEALLHLDARLDKGSRLFGRLQGSLDYGYPVSEFLKKRDVQAELEAYPVSAGKWFLGASAVLGQNIRSGESLVSYGARAKILYQISPDSEFTLALGEDFPRVTELSYDLSANANLKLGFFHRHLILYTQATTKLEKWTQHRYQGPELSAGLLLNFN